MPTHSGPNLIEDGLVLSLDAGDKNSYPLSGLEVEYLIVGGGGGGGTTHGPGGGGGGGAVIRESVTVSSQTHSIVVGAGGTFGSFGGDSTAFSVTAGGGARGVSGRNNLTLKPGNAPAGVNKSSGGGGGGNQSYGGGSLGGAGSSPGKAGGNGYADGRSGGGGGGGAGTTGGSTFDRTGGNGGLGITDNITGNSNIYGSGGGGGSDNTTIGLGGPGAGDGSRRTGDRGGNADSNRGGGGGGPGGGNNAVGGGNGGSGIVVIRYKGKQKATGGDLIYRYKNYTVHVFENSDNFVVGNTITDITGNQNPATLRNGVGSSTDNLGALDFDGVDDYIIIPNTNLPAPANNLTLECLFQRNSGRTIINYGHSSAGASKYYCFEITTTKLKSIIFTTTQTTLSSITDINSNTWYHAVLTYDGTTMKMYINGVLEASTSISGNISNSLTPSLNIGRKNGGNGEYINGKVAMIKLYNRALTPQEVQQNYNSQKSRFGL